MKAVTHPGLFHADDVLAAAILRYVHGKKLEIHRTRDPKEIESADIVFDVGGVYDPERRRYDHHQLEGAGVRPNGIPYSSAGLVWKHEFKGPEVVRDFVDEQLICGVDALDNGVKLNTSTVKVMSFSDIISYQNPLWDDYSPEYTNRFWASEMLASDVLHRLIRTAESQLEAESIVLKALENRQHEHIVVLPRFCPWQEVLAQYPEVLYVVFLDRDSGTWRAQCVPTEPNGFECRKRFPAAWLGLCDSALAAISGVSDSIFCHRNGFIAGAVTKEGAIALAESSV